MERSNEDLMEDKARNEAMKHPELVDIVFKDWLSDLCPLEFLTVYYRLCYSFLSGKVLPWKEVSNRLYKSDITERYYSRRHLLRIFNDTIRKIERKI